MQNSQHRILTGFAFFAGTIAIAILGYIGFGWTPLEAAYMVIITIFGVGYGEVKPLEGTAQKVFTMLETRRSRDDEGLSGGCYGILSNFYL